MFARSEHLASLDWSQIRREYEAGVSPSMLAQLHGIASVTTIRRKIAKEDWRTPDQRDADAGKITQYVPPVAAPLPEQERVPDVPPSVALPEGDGDAEMIPAAEVIAEQALRDTAVQIQAGRPEVEMPGTEQLAQLHTERIKEQLAISTRVTSAGLRVFEIITEMLDDDGEPESVGRARMALMKLTNMNPDRETLASLLKVASDVVSRGVAIELRALGMDIQRRPGAPSEAAPDPVASNRPASGLIKMLDIETVFKLRHAAQRSIMERRQAAIAEIVEAE
jgi:hypothetical protein